MAGLCVTSACSPILGLITGNDHRGFTTSYYYYPWFVAWKLSLEKVNDLAQILRARQLPWAPPPSKNPAWCVGKPSFRKQARWG